MKVLGRADCKSCDLSWKSFVYFRSEIIKMNCSELDSFIQKFKHLWHSGVNAHLDVNTHAGHAWVHLHVQLGQAPGPLHPQAYQPHHRKKDSPSRQRRRARRAEGRQNKKPAEEVPFKPTENVEAEIEVEEAPIKPTENVETKLEAV